MFSFAELKEVIIHWDDTSSDYEKVFAAVSLEGKAQGNKLPRDKQTGKEDEAFIVIELRARVIQDEDIIVSLIVEYTFAIFYKPDEIRYEDLQQISEYARMKLSMYFNQRKGNKVRLLTIPEYHSDLSGLKVLYDIFRL